MWVLRRSPSELLRQEDTSNPGFVLWGCPDLLRGTSAAGPMPGVWEGEAREAELAREQSLLHEAVWDICRAEMPNDDGEGCGERVEIGLAYGEGIGQGVHGGATPTESRCCSWGDRG